MAGHWWAPKSTRGQWRAAAGSGGNWAWSAIAQQAPLAPGIPIRQQWAQVGSRQQWAPQDVSGYWASLLNTSGYHHAVGSGHQQAAINTAH